MPHQQRQTRWVNKNESRLKKIKDSLTAATVCNKETHPQDEKEVNKVPTKRATLLAVRRKSSTSSAASSIPRRTRLNSILNSDSDMSFR